MPPPSRNTPALIRLWNFNYCVVQLLPPLWMLCEHYLNAKKDTFIADKGLRPGDQLHDFAISLSAEGTLWLSHDGSQSEFRFLSVSI